jgi:tetratricopeptide (TPR) repeat protein
MRYVNANMRVLVRQLWLWAAIAAAQPPDPFQQAVSLIQQGQPAPAVEIVQKILAKSPSDIKALNLLGIALAASGRRAEAAAAWEKALKINPNFVPVLKNLGANEIVLGKRKEARARFEAARKLAPADPMAHFALAEIAYEDKRFADAAAGYAKSGDLPARDPAALLRMATACAETGKRDEAAAAIAKLGPGADAQTRFAAGMLLVRLERFEEAARQFESAEGYTAGYNAALAYFQAGKFEDTLRVAGRLDPAEDRKAELWNLMAHAHEKSGRTKEAYDLLRQATEINPLDELSYLDLIGLCLEHQNYELGQEIADIGLKRLPASHRLRIARGVIHALNGKIELAEKDFAGAAESAPPDVSLPLVSRGLILLQMDRAAEAVELFRARARTQPGDYLVNWFLAEALIRQGAAPGTPEEKEAEAALNASIKSAPKNAATRLMLGKLLLKRGDLPAAAKHLEQAMALDPKDASAAYQLGMLYRRQGDARRAQQMFAKVGKGKQEEQEQIGAGTLMRIIRENAK